MVTAITKDGTKTYQILEHKWRNPRAATPGLQYSNPQSYQGPEDFYSCYFICWKVSTPLPASLHLK